jgi:hypothetical protein
VRPGPVGSRPRGTPDSLARRRGLLPSRRVPVASLDGRLGMRCAQQQGDIVDRPDDQTTTAGPSGATPVSVVAEGLVQRFGPLEMRVLPSDYPTGAVDVPAAGHAEMLRVRLGATEFVDLGHDGSHWFAVPLRIDASGPTPFDQRRRDPLGVGVGEATSVVLDAASATVRRWATLVPPESRLGTAWPAPQAFAPGAAAGVPAPKRSRGVLFGVLGAVGVLAFGGVSFALYQANGGEGGIIETGSALVSELTTGDCFEMTDGIDDEYQTFVDVTSCGEVHHFEVFGEPLVDDETFPGDDEVSRLADEACYAAFDDYVGSSWEDSALDFGWFTPTEDGWAAGDREVTCYLATAPEGETASLAGSGR